MPENDDRCVPLKVPYRDVNNAEHDMAVGPCACGGWHNNDVPPAADAEMRAWYASQRPEEEVRRG